MERGEAEQSLQMFYSKGEIIAGSWSHLILLIDGFKRESGFPLACSLTIDLSSTVHSAL